ncbi:MULTISPECIES: MAGa3780 family membrane protein [unclassified Mycoplasma]|uniref:MAGa3780 family membrane protein n=1 Tax=unclassified Mycoplasma TaxID=2683645 RepID=UPI00216AB43F|nr:MULTISPECIES: hypothetical protein [unclassified Mycoplasma]MCS4536594.1 hypothetical protein [Mycoplasma sp. CSL7475-4]MCT4469587.1 hypothetical protein [Mycoplasma sp. HS2188]
MKNIKLNNLKENKNYLFLTLGLFILLGSFIFILMDSINYNSSYEIDLKTLTPTVYALFKHAGTIFYFTYLTNLFTGITLILFSIIKNREKILKMFVISVGLITITFLVYWLLLSWRKETWSTFYSAIRSTITHAINPVIAFVVLFLLRKTAVISSKEIKTTAIITIAYCLFALIIYFASYNKFVEGAGVTIYSFLNFTKPLFYTGGNLGVVIFLDILIFALAVGLSLSTLLFWKGVYKIKFVKCQRHK